MFLGVTSMTIRMALFCWAVTTAQDDPVAPRPQNAPENPEWDGKNFLTLKDVEAMGADIKSPKPLAYSRDGTAHRYQMGLGELEMKIWVYMKEDGAQSRLDDEAREDKTNAALLLKMKKATVAEVSEKENGYLKKVIRSDGWGAATRVERRGTVVVKVLRTDECRTPQELEEIVKRGEKATAYVLKKLSVKAAPAKPAFPMKIGSSWLYQAGEKKLLVRISGQELVNKTLCYVVETEGPDKSATLRLYVELSPKGIVLHRIDQGGAGAPLETPLLLVQMPCAIGTRWESSCKPFAVRGEAQGESPVELDGKNYACARCPIAFTSGDTKFEWVVWHHPEIGFAKLQMNETVYKLERVLSEAQPKKAEEESTHAGGADPLRGGLVKETRCMTNLKQLGVYGEAYRKNNSGTSFELPAELGKEYFEVLLKTAIPESEKGIVTCPYSEKPEGTVGYRGPARNVNAARNYKAGDPIAACDHDHPDGSRYVLTKGYQVIKADKGSELYKKALELTKE